MDYLRNLNFFIKGTQSKAGSANSQPRRSADNAGAHSQTGSANAPSQEGVQVLIPR